LASTERWKIEVGATVTAYRRWTRRGCGRDAEVTSFYSRALHGGNMDLRKEGEWEVMTRRGSRAGVRSRGVECSEAATGVVKGTRGVGILSVH
jgi:hypothetical protein